MDHHYHWQGSITIFVHKVPALLFGFAETNILGGRHDTLRYSWERGRVLSQLDRLGFGRAPEISQDPLVLIFPMEGAKDGALGKAASEAAEVTERGEKMAEAASHPLPKSF